MQLLDDFDLLDITFRLEKRLALKIPKPDERSLRTVGDFADHVVSIANAKPSPICPTVQCFYQLRAAIRRDFNIPENRITPTTTVHSIFQARDPRSAWKKLTRSLNLKLPDLDYPEFVAFIAGLWMFAAIILPLALAAIFDRRMLLAACLGLPLSVLSIMLLDYLLRPFLARRIPRHLQTLGDLALLAAANSPTKSTQTIWSAVQITLAEQLALNPRRIRRRTTFREIITGS